MRIYVKNTPAKFHLDPIWNDAALGFFEDGLLNKKNKMSSDMRSVPDPIRLWEFVINRQNTRHSSKNNIFWEC